MSTADEEPFLDAILARPDDDGPRLIYADFLESSGDPATAARGELVRVQVALARLSDGDTPQGPGPALAERQAELLQRYADAWAAELLDIDAGVEFRRGIPDAVYVDAAAFLARGDGLFRRTRVGAGRSLVRRVRLLNAVRVMPRLIHCPFLGLAPELDLCGNDLGNGGVNLLVRSPYLGPVEVLDLGFNGLDDVGVGVLAKAATLPNLRALALNDNGQVTGNGVLELAGSPFLGGLESLDLSGNDVNDAGVRAVVESRPLARLHTLRLAGNHIGDGGVAALAGSPLLRRILARDARLDLRSNAIGPAGAEVLARSPTAAAADELDLTGNCLRDAGVGALLGGPHLGGLRALWLGQNEVTDAGAAALAEGLGRFPRLRRLDVAGNRLTRRGIDQLAAAADARGVVAELGGNVHYPPAAVPPVSVGEVVDGVLDGVANLKRRVSHPTRRSGP
jgi:uncharacterized protein (TIGR02996 family)